MPSSNLYLIARFKANGSGRIDFGKNDTSLGISSVRDLRWKNYFVQNSQLTGNFFSVPSNNKVMLDSSAPSGYNNYTNIKMGYAVEFEFDSLNVTKDTSELEIQATFYNDNNNIISRTSLKDAITGKELDPSYTNFSNKTQPSKFTRVMDFNTLNNGVTSPGVTWNFIYYLPARLSNLNNTALNTNNIKVKLDIFLKDNSGKTLLNYITFINNNDCPWNGQVFRYSTKESLLDDIKDSNTY
jgi:hypothetical protein